MKKRFVYSFLAGSFALLMVAVSSASANAPSPDNRPRSSNLESSGMTEIGGGVMIEGTGNAMLSVPFMFAVGGSVLPSGTYRVAPMGDDPQMLQLISNDGRRHALVGTVWGRGANTDARGRAVFTFKDYAGDEVLTAVALPDDYVRSIVMPGKTLEKDLRTMALIRFRTESTR
jgi:hypothetical protein